ncbi:unnamed protein product [Cunninghamella blakesleeana]
MDIDKQISPETSNTKISESIHLSASSPTMETSSTTCCFNPSTATISIIPSENQRITVEEGRGNTNELIEGNSVSINGGAMDEDCDRTIAPTIKHLQQSFNNINSSFISATTSTSKNTSTYKVFEVPDEYLNNKVEIKIPSIPSNDNKEEFIALPIYKITADQYINLMTKFREHSLQYADQILFPWLHGVDGNDYQQNLFFGVRGGKMKIPNYRGQILIHANESYSTFGRLTESFLPQDVLSVKEGRGLEGEEFGYNNGHGNENDHQQYRFKVLSKPENQGIHLRHFKIQSYRYASISDIFIYGNGDDDQQLLNIGKRFAQAHYHLYHERQLHHEKLKKSGGKRAILNANQLIYRVFIIEDGLSTFEKKYPELIWYSSNGTLVNDFSFLDRERIEMQNITSCNEITKNIWVGNTQDAPMSLDIDKDDVMEDGEQHDDDVNPNKFSVCIECHDLADIPSPSILTLAKETLNDLAPDELPSDIIHLDMYSTASNVMVPEVTQEQLNSFLSDLLHLLKFMEDMVHIYDRRVLMHCSDGYTESSILALSWIMFHKKISLPEAYLYFQEKRNFFIISSDVPFLKYIEQFIQTYHHHQQQQQQSPTVSSSNLNLQKRKRGDESPLETSESSSSIFNNINSNTDNLMKLHPSKKNDILHPAHQRILLSDQYINTVSNVNTSSDLENESNTINSSHDNVSNKNSNKIEKNSDEEDEDAMIDGYILSSPNHSIINHANTDTTNNSDSQHHSISTDTNSQLPPLPSSSSSSSTTSSLSSSSSILFSALLSSCHQPPQSQLQNYSWFYSPRFEGSFPSRILPLLYLGNLNHATNPAMLKTLGITHVVSVGENAGLSSDDFRVLLLDNLYDDGIDSIKSSYEETMAFIDEAYNQGTKCLVHCRVGVSRSATVTICYLMHRFKMNLADAYIYVRTRRLNVIIQPNLKFMFEMIQLEQQLKGAFHISWPAFCHEIYLLNQSYSDE